MLNRSTLKKWFSFPFLSMSMTLNHYVHKECSECTCPVHDTLPIHVVLRTLGIPARPVTNFESAHDGDGNRALDRYWDLQDQLVHEKSHDSIW